MFSYVSKGVNEQEKSNLKAILFWYAGCDAAFIGPNDDQFAILDEDKTGLSMYILPKLTTMEENEKNLLSEENQKKEADPSGIQGPQQFMFETEVDRVFSTPIGDVASDNLILEVTDNLILEVTYQLEHAIAN